jgi:hypothetical protein
MLKTHIRNQTQMWPGASHEGLWQEELHGSLRLCVDVFMRLCVYEGGLFSVTGCCSVPPPVVEPHAFPASLNLISDVCFEGWNGLLRGSNFRESGNFLSPSMEQLEKH